MVSKLARIVYVLAFACATLVAQNTAGTASISGVVTDATGATVPGAKVAVDNQSKGIHREISTTEGGVFDAAALVPASGYAVTITKEGFSTYQVKDINLTVGQTLNLAPKLDISSASTKVEVTSEAPIVDTAKPDVSSLVSSLQIMDLPINGR